MNAKRIGADLSIFSRTYLRNPVALFFSLAFPIILIVLFGLIFQGSSGNTTLYTVNLDGNTVASQEFIQALDKTGAITVQLMNESSVNGNLSTWLGQNGHPVGLVIPAGFNTSFFHKIPIAVTLYVNPQDQASSGIAEGAVQGVLNGFNLNASGGSVIVYATTSNVGSQIYTYFDYLVPGLIGFSILISPMFSMVSIAASYRKEGLFRQLALTPLTKAEWLTAKILWYTMLTFISAAIILFFGDVLFHSSVTFSLGVVPFLILGPLLFVSLGLLVGSVAKTEESAAVVGNIITFPMMFLAGTFFPVSQFSPPLQAVAHVFPLYYVIDGMNQVLLFNNVTRALTDLGIVLAMAIAVFVAAILAFRFRDK